jgi:hypothetical protein
MAPRSQRARSWRLERQHRPAVVEAGRPAGAVQAHEREQSQRLGLARHELGELRGEPLGLLGQVGRVGRNAVA